MATVRAAIQSYLASAGVTGLTKVFKGMPAIQDPALWNLSGQLGWGAVAFVHLTEHSEGRIADPFVLGQKEVEYIVGIVVQYRYAIPVENASALSGDEWTTGLDTVLEGLKAAIRADPNHGTGTQGAIWQAGQEPGGLKVRSELPTMDEQPGEVWVWNVLEYHVTEIITA
jgi:hypothetical protein